MKTTLAIIKSEYPCEAGWEKLIKSLGTDDPNTEVSMEHILNSNGVMDMLWAFRCLNEEPKMYCKFLEYLKEYDAYNYAYNYTYSYIYAHSYVTTYASFYSNSHIYTEPGAFGRCIRLFSDWWHTHIKDTTNN